MTQNIIKEENFIKTISEYFEIIPYLGNNKIDDKINNKYYDFKESKSYKQAFYNNLINLYNKKYYYSIINDIINTTTLKAYSEDEDQNLLLNVRKNNYESTFKYIFGYKPLNAKTQRYYYYRKISPNNVNENEEEYIYADVDNYNDYIIPCELKTIGKSKSMYKNILLNSPLILKYYKQILSYSINYKNIINIIKKELKTLNCEQYLTFFDTIKNVDQKKILKENNEDYFYMLTAMFLDKEFNNLELDTKTIGYMLYYILKNKPLCSLKLNLPPVVNVDNLNFLKETITDNIPKRVITGKKKPSSIQEFFGNNYIAVTDFEKSQYNESLKQGFENLFNGGYSNNSEENKKIVMRIRDIENTKDDKIILTQTILPVLKDIKRHMIDSSEHLKHILFNHVVIDEEFYQSLEFKRDLNKIYELINKSLYIVTYDLNDFDFNVFSLSNIPDEKKFIQVYMYYFNIIKNMCYYLVNNKTSTEKQDLDFLIYELGLMVLKTLDIIGKLSINDVLAFRYYTEYYYNLLNLINKKMPFIAIIPYLNSIIENYNENVVRKFVGGDPSSFKIINFTNLYSFDFFSYSYLFDILTNLQEENNYQEEFYKPMNRPDNLFWDGMCFEEYNSLSNNEKLIHSIVSYTMFINETANGDKMSFKIDTNNKIKRVCFLSKLINDKTTVAKLLNNLVNQLDQDTNYEKNIETFLTNINVILKNTDVAGLIKKLHKLDTPEATLAFTSYIKNNTKDKTQTTASNNTFIELLVFVCVFLKKLGFKLNKNYSKTNLKLEIEPKLTKDNILKYLNETGKKEFSEQYNKFLEDNNELIDFLIINSVDNNVYNMGGNEKEDNKSVILLCLQDSSILENSISDKVLDAYENNTIINSFENNIVNVEDVFVKEKELLYEDIRYLLNLDELTDKNLYRIIPNYIKTQYNAFKSYNFLDQVFSPSNTKGGGHPIDELLTKLSDFKPSTCSNNIINETDLKEKINLILNERFLKNLNNNTLLYYDNILFNNDRNVYKTALYSTIKNFEYLKNVYKINMTTELKETLFNLYTDYSFTEQCIYQIFIVSEYIKKFINFMYQKLGIQHDSYDFNYEKFLKFYSILECKFKEKTQAKNKLYEFMNKHNLQKLSMQKTRHKYKEVDAKTLETLFKENNKPMETENPSTSTS